MFYGDLLYQLKNGTWAGSTLGVADISNLRLTMSINGTPICTSLTPVTAADGGKDGAIGTLEDLSSGTTDNVSWPYIRWWLNDTQGSDRLSLNCLADTNNYTTCFGNRFYFTYNLNNSSVTPAASDVVYMKLELVNFPRDFYLGKAVLTTLATGFGDSTVTHNPYISTYGDDKVITGLVNITNTD